MLYFKNKGLIDLRAIKTFGVSSKVNDNPIGFFGTGLKYAIAIVLREGGRIHLSVGQERYTFSCETTKIRNDSFELVRMNDEELGFTTDLGKNWEMWEAYRELRCNCVDEKGEIGECESVFPLEEDTTTFYVESPAMADIHKDKDQYFISEDRVPLWQNSDVAVYSGASEHLYRKGILAYDTGISCRYTYDFADLDLTEDRTISCPYTAMKLLSLLVAKSEDPDMIRTFVCLSGSRWEDLRFGYGSANTVSDTFRCVVSELIRTTDLDLNESAREFVMRENPELGKPNEIQLNSVQNKQLEKARDFLNKLGYEGIDTCDVKVTQDMDKNVLGQVYQDQIYLAERVFNMGTKSVAATLLEEYLHATSKYEDLTYEFQNFLFDTIMTMGERLLDEPL